MDIFCNILTLKKISIPCKLSTLKSSRELLNSLTFFQAFNIMNQFAKNNLHAS